MVPRTCTRDDPAELAGGLRLPQAELGELRGAQRQLLGHEELVELRRRDAGAREHRVDLAAVVDLVLEQVHEHVARALDLNVIAALEAHLGGGIGQRVDERDEPEIARALGRAQRDELGVPRE